MLSHTMYAIAVALVALILACALAGSFRIEPFDDEPTVVVEEADHKLDAVKLPPEEGEAEKGRKGRMENRVPLDKIPTEEDGADMSEEAPAEDPVPPPRPPTDEMPEDDAPPSPPPMSEGFAVEPFVGGMMARF